MVIQKGTILLVFFTLLLSACKDDEPIFSTTPEIELVSVQPEDVTQFVDTFSITIRYKDGDGDLGFIESDSSSLYILDQRLEAYDHYYVAPLAPPDEEIPIQGTLNIPVGKLFLFGVNPTETTRFKIKLRDRAGNWSNEIETGTVTIRE